MTNTLTHPALGLALLIATGCAGNLPGDDAGERPDAGGRLSPFAVAVVSFEPGDGAGFGQDAMPDIVLGEPNGLGDAAGGTDVLSLGRGGVLVLELGQDAVDGPGADLVVFENAFLFGNNVFAEPGEVAVSADGEAWLTFDCDAETGNGCAGQVPVYASESNGIDALSDDGGGDRFDLADVGADRVRYVSITDVGDVPVPPDTDNNGFDVDAVAALHVDE